MFDNLGPEGIAAFITVIGVIIAALVSFLGARYAAKQSTIVSRETNDTDNWDKLVKSLQTEMTRLGEKVEGLEKRATGQDARIASLETQVREGDAKYRVALQYIRDIIAWTVGLLKGEALPPVAPPLIASDLEMH